MADQGESPEFKLSPYAPPVPERGKLGLDGWLATAGCIAAALLPPALLVWSIAIASDDDVPARGVMFRLGLLGILFVTPAAIVAAVHVIKEFKSRPATPDK